MEEQEQVQVAIVMPTLDRDKGQEVAEKMAKAAGIPTLVLVSTDHKQLGSTKVGNIGLTTAYESGATHICYVNDDVWFEQIGWLKRLVEAVDSHPQYGIAGPGIKCVTLPQMLGRPDLPPGIIPAKMLTFSCAVIKREVFENIGYLDETFIHFGSDTDYCMRARQAGYRLVWVRDVYAFHDYKLVAERSEQVREWKLKDEQTYRKLWGDFEYRLEEG
jgi:GT2 family glycosyltransferase